MRLIAKITQTRRDFNGRFECEHCGWVNETRGYDDLYYHQTVIPMMVCRECGKTGNGPTTLPDVPAHVIL